MSETAFAKAFLASLDGRHIKLPADYVEDARNYPNRLPYVLPRMPKPMRKPAATAAAAAATAAASGQERGVAVSVKSLHRGQPVLDVARIGAAPMPLSTSLLDVRTALAEQTHVPLAKLKLLFNKKPVPDSKVLQDLVAGDGTSTHLELGVMVVGGAATVTAAQEEAAAATAAAKAAAVAVPAEKPVKDAGTTAAAPTNVVEGEAFWTDLRSFLVGRIPDSKQADEVFSLFLRAWEERMV